MSGNLFELRKDWPIPPAITSNPPIKIEPQPQELATPSATTAPKAEKCGLGPNCPICKNIEEDWDGDYQKQIQQNTPNTQVQDAHQPHQGNLQQAQDAQQPHVQGFQHPHTQGSQRPQYL